MRAAEPEGPIAGSRARGDVPAVASRDVTASRVQKTPQMLAEPKHGGGAPDAGHLWYRRAHGGLYP